MRIHAPSITAVRSTITRSPAVSHVSLQSSDLEKASDYIAQYHKPFKYDECKYEGNIPKRWGNISAQEMVRQFWLGTVSGAGQPGRHYLLYFDVNQPVEYEFDLTQELPEGL
jgi:hypothetical protein